MTAGKRYSAGAIFLQVVPVFADVQKSIERDVEDIGDFLGDEMEKSGDKAGKRAGKAASKSMRDEVKKGTSGMSDDMEHEFRAGVTKMDKALGDIDTKNLGKKLRAEVKGMREELKSLNDVDLKVDVDVIKAEAKIAALKAKIEEMRKRSSVFFDIKGLSDVYRGVAKAQAAIDSVDGTIKIDVDTRGLERNLGSFERAIKKSMDRASSHIRDGAGKEIGRLKSELDYLSKLRVNIDIPAAQLHREIGEIMAELAALSKDRTVAVDVRFDAKKAYAELAVWNKALDRADGRNVTAHAKLDTKQARAGLFGLKRSGDDAANSFRSFNAILFMAATAGPALVPVLIAIAGGLLLIGPAAAVAAAALTAVIIGFSGIGGALTALQAREDAAARTSQSYARTEVSSARAVADARRSAARAVASALEQQRNAQEAYRNSIQDVNDAEQALAQARAAARSTGSDIARQIKSNQLDISQGQLDSFNATVNFNSVMADGSSTNAEREQARIQMEQAKIRLEELRIEAKKLAKEKKKWDKEGVNGTEAVQSAQDRLNDALDAQKDAYQALGDAAQAVDQARADGARSVADAIDSQAMTLEAVNAQQGNVDAAFDKLGGSGKKFALFLFGLRDDFYSFRDDIQGVLLPSIQDAIEGFIGSDNGSTARDAMLGLADSFGRITQALSVSFQGPVWGAFFQMLADLGPEIQDAYGGAFINFLSAMAGILTTLAPFALDFARGFENMMDGFDRWANSKAGREDLQGFMDFVERVGPPVVDFIKALARGFGAIIEALAPWGGVVLDGLTGFLNLIADMDPKLLSALVAGIVILASASQFAYLIMNALMAGAALLTSTVGLWVFAIVGIGLALVYLYTQNKGFAAWVDEMWDVISKAVKDAWEKYIKPALIELWDALKYLWDEVLVPFFRWLGPIILWIAKKIIPLIGQYFAFVVKLIVFVIRKMLVPTIKFLAKIFGWLWKHVLKPVFKFIGEAAVWLWKHFLKPAFKEIGREWGILIDGMEWVWDHILKPVWDFIVDKALPKLQGAFQTAIDAIKKIWGGLKAVVGKPIKFVLETIINNGLIAGFNKVAGWVGMKGFDPIPIPDALSSYATGGVLPGYTPGRDVHQFVSPTAGRLELSGGEAIMRPEWTAAMGSGYVDHMNDLARKGGVNAIRNAMSGAGYWLGGVLPLFGASVVKHDDYANPAYDMNVGSGYDDYGMGIHAWKPGIVAQRNYVGDESYGRWVVMNHAGGQNSLYAHMSRFGLPQVGERVDSGAVLGYVGDLGNTGTPPTSHLHFEIKGGTVDYSDTGDKGEHHKSIPGWLMGVLKNPLAAVKHWAVDPLKDAAAGIKNSPIYGAVTKVPLLLAEKFTDKIWDVVPGWAKTAAGWAGDAAGWAVGGIKAAGGAVSDVAHGAAGAAGDAAGAVANFLGFADGGILPYNGTMKYDTGGMLPPGLTSVVNLTGKPEPVFTSDQWDGVSSSTGGDTYHYEPHFDGSDLTAEDIAGDVNAGFRRLKRSGKYGKVGG